MKRLVVSSCCCCSFVLMVRQFEFYKTNTIILRISNNKNKTFSCLQLRLSDAWHFLTTRPPTICHRLKFQYSTRLPSKMLRRPMKVSLSTTIDAAIIISNRRLRQLKIQLTKCCQLVLGFDPFTILCLLSLVHTNTAKLLWFSSTAKKKTKTAHL